jgi:putative ABC transport system permease protein
VTLTTGLRFWRIAERLAWRDLRRSPLRSAFIMLTMALSVASICGVRSAANVARKALQSDSRAWLAGDLGVDTTEPVSDTQVDALDKLKSIGIDWTLVTLASTMAASDQSPDPGFISVKAVDTAAYPFYGKVALNPDRTLKEALHADTLIASQEVLERLQVRVGDTIAVGGERFRIAALIRSDPARFSNDLGLGMRCILSRQGYARLDVDRSGISVRNRVLLRLPAGSDLAGPRQLLETLIPGGSIRDYRAGYRQQTETAISFLSVTAFLALVLGAIGVAVAVREHAEHCLPTLAVMRMLGARSSQTAAVFFVQIGFMMTAAFALGVPLGFVVRVSILSLASRYLVLPPVSNWELGLIAQTAGASLLAMMPILVQPARMIRHLRPALVLRRDFETRSLSSSKRWIAAAVSAAIFAFLAYGMLRSWSSAVLLVAALSAGVGISSTLTEIAIRALRRWTFSNRARRTPLFRLGITGLCRPGHRSRTVIVALSIALALMIATFETSEAVVAAVFNILPYERNSLYIARFRDSHKDGLRAMLERQPGVESVEIITEARLRLRRVDQGDLFDLPCLVVCDGSTSGLVLSDELARQFRARVGSRLQFESRNQTIQPAVTSIRRLTPAERVWAAMKLDCSSLDRRSLFHQAVVRIAPDRIAAVRQVVIAEYPMFAVITAEDVSETVRAVGHDAMTLARMVAWFAIGAGLSVLAAIVTSSRRARLREIGILSALGASGSTLRKLYTIEFAAIGALSAAIASILACGFTSIMLSVVFFRLKIAMEWKPILASLLVAVALTVAGGWLPTFSLLSRKPMDVMRGE